MQHPNKLAALYCNYPLDHTRVEIRLLILHPGKWENPISCDFKVVSLMDQPVYSALSYVWGQEEPDYIANIGSYPIPIRQNLFAALRRLRAHAAGKDYTVWIDALCIDQANTDERNSQVAMMGQIYSVCTSTLVWFGEMEFAPEIWPGCPIDANPGRCYTVEHGKRRLEDEVDIDEIIGNIPVWEGWLRIATYLSLMAAEGIVSHFGYLVNYNLTKDERQERHFTRIIKALEGNEWFRRLWVVQEFILAPVVMLYIGPVVMPWSIFSSAREGYQGHIDWPYASSPEDFQVSCRALLDRGVTRFVEFALFKKYIRERTQRQTVLELRLQLSQRSASVDLDQIYSLYGIVEYVQNHAGEGSIRGSEDKPDYNGSSESTYIATSLAHMGATQSLLALSLSGYKQNYPNTPSWAIDWTALQSDITNFDHRLWTEMYGNFHADRGLGERQLYLTSTTGVLSLQGVLLDEIAIAARFGHAPEFCTFMDMMQKYDPDVPYTGHQQKSWAEAWFRTILADSVRSYSPSSGFALRRLDQTQYYEGILQRLHIILESYNPWKLNGTGSTKDNRSEQATVWGKYLWHGFNNSTPPASSTMKSLETLARALRAQAQGILSERTLFLTRNGYIGVTHKCRPGNQIFVFQCGNTPVILEEVADTRADKTEQGKERLNADYTTEVRVEEGQQYRVVSDCYLHGFMDGEHNERLLEKRGRLGVVSII